MLTSVVVDYYFPCAKKKTKTSFFPKAALTFHLTLVGGGAQAARSPRFCSHSSDRAFDVLESRKMPRSQEPGESDDASEPKLVLAGVRSKSTKRLMNLGFEITARVVEDEASGVVVKDYPEVTLRVIKDDKYTYEMLQLNVQTGFGVRTNARRRVPRWGKRRGGGGRVTWFVCPTRVLFFFFGCFFNGCPCRRCSLSLPFFLSLRVSS